MASDFDGLVQAEGGESVAMENSPNEPILDRAEGLRSVGGREKLLAELIAVFLADLPRLQGMIRSAIVQQSLLEVSRAAHALKGSASTIGAAEVARLAAVLEQSGKESNVAQAELHEVKLSQAVERLVKAASAEIT